MHNGNSVIFNSVSQALSFINNQNPARARYKNLLEAETKSSTTYKDFSGDSPEDIYAATIWAVKRVLSFYTGPQRAAFELRELGPRSQHLAVEDIAELIGVSKETIYKWLRRIRDDLEQELIKRELMEDDSRDYESNRV